MKFKTITNAPTAFNLLNGVVCVFKSAGESCHRVRDSFLGKLSRELCEFECRKPKIYKSSEIDEHGQITLKTYENLADHPLVVGPKYGNTDFKCNWSTFLGKDTAGVLVLGLNDATRTVYKLHKNHPMRVYHINGTFGQATDNLYKTGRIIDKSSFKHIRSNAFESLLASIQASHQRNMYQLCGVDPQSQAAYELAAKGLVRPESSEVPIIYATKSIEFDPPNFTIEVHCVNEYEAYLKALVHSIGIQLKSLATCTGLRCLRHSYFSIDHALLKKHWTLEHVIENIGNNRMLLRRQGKIQSGLLQSVDL